MLIADLFKNPNAVEHFGVGKFPIGETIIRCGDKRKRKNLLRALYKLNITFKDIYGSYIVTTNERKKRGLHESRLHFKDYSKSYRQSKKRQEKQSRKRIKVFKTKESI